MDLVGRNRDEHSKRLDRAVQANGSAYSAIRGALYSGQELVWGNVAGEPGKGPTPEEVVATLGTDAAAWFMSARMAARQIALAELSAQGVKVPSEAQLEAAAPAVMPAGWTYVINADGTVTLNRPIQ